MVTGGGRLKHVPLANNADGLLHGEHMSSPQRIVRQRLGGRRGRWLAISYDQSFRSQPTRPLLLAHGDGRTIKAIMPAALFGSARWIGFIPRGFVEFEVLVFEARAEDFRVTHIAEFDLLTLQPNLWRRGPRHLWRFWSQHFWDLFATQGRWIRHLPERYPLAKIATVAAKRARPLELAGLDRVAVGNMVVGFLLFVRESENEADLAATLRSLRDQRLDNWRLTICVTGTSPSAAKLVAETADSRIDAIETAVAATGQTSVANLFRGAAPTVIGFLRPGDRLADEALVAILGNLDCAPPFLYSDSIVMGDADQPAVPDFSPDWSPEYLRRTDYIGGLWLIGRDVAAAILPALMLAAGDFRQVLTNAALKEGARAVIRHLRRPILIRERGRASDRPATMSRPAIREIAPTVSIVVPTRDRLDLLRRAIETVREKTVYPNYGIVVVDNASSNKATLAYLDRLGAENIAVVVRDGGDFNFSRLINKGVAAATGEVVVLLNNDTFVIDPNWLGELVSLAVRPGNGAIGAKLLYPNATLQHVGVVLGMGGYAGHRFRHSREHYPDYWGRLRHVHEVSAVTGACLAVTRANFERVGGFDESFAVDFNDIDFCLRLRELGLRNIWTPHAVMGHVESASRGDTKRKRSPRFQAEADKFAERWRAEIPNDPYFHPGLALQTSDETLE